MHSSTKSTKEENFFRIRRPLLHPIFVTFAPFVVKKFFLSLLRKLKTFEKKEKLTCPISASVSSIQRR